MFRIAFKTISRMTFRISVFYFLHLVLLGLTYVGNLTVVTDSFAETFRLGEKGQVQLYVRTRKQWIDFDPVRASFLNDPQTKSDQDLKREYENFTRDVALRSIADQKTTIDTTSGQEKCEVSATPVYKTGQWGFSSDHLPVGARAKVGDTEFGIATFNLLNESYKHYIHQGQALTGSTLDKMTETQRTTENAEIVLNALTKLGVGVFCIQEANLSFYNKLVELVSSSFEVLRVRNGTKNDYGIVVYDKNKFLHLSWTYNLGQLLSPVTSNKYVASTIAGTRKGTEALASHASKLAPRTSSFVQGIIDMVTPSTQYSTSNGTRNKYIQAIKLQNKEGGQSFIVVNTHMELGQGNQLVGYLNGIDEPVIVMGDLNLGYKEAKPQNNIAFMQRNLKEGFHLLENATPFSHVNSRKVLDVYDHIISKEVPVEADTKLTEALQKNFSLDNRE